MDRIEFTNRRLSDHILSIGVVGVGVFISAVYESVILGLIFYASVLFVISYTSRNNNSNDIIDVTEKVTKKVESITSKITESPLKNNNSNNKATISATLSSTTTTTVESVKNLTPSKNSVTPIANRTPPPPPNRPAPSPISTPVKNLAQSTPTSPITPQATTNSYSVSAPNTPTPTPTPTNFSSTNTTPSSSPIAPKPNIPSSPPQSLPPLPPLPSVKVITNNQTKSEAIIEKGKKIGKIIPQIPGAITDIKKEFKETSKDKKSISTLRGIIGGVYKNISSPPQLSAEDKEKELKRRKVAEEILQTEKVYVGKLKAINDVYLTPLKVAATENPHPPLTLDQIHTIFSEILTIYNYNSHLLHKLEERIKDSSTILNIGELFISITDFLKSYKGYINNYPKAMQTLEKVKKNQNVELLLQTFQANPACDNLDLNSLLIMPVQRIPRYILLLSEILKYTDSKNSDYDSLKKALDKMKDLASEINENKRDSELLSRMYEIQNSLEGFTLGDFIHPSRKLVLDNEFYEKVFKTNSPAPPKSSSSPRRYLLCNDILLRCKVKGKKLIVIEVFDINEIIFKEMAGEKLSIVSKSQTDVIVLKSVDENQEEKWLDSINHWKKINLENKSSFKRLSSKNANYTNINFEEYTNTRSIDFGFDLVVSAAIIDCEEPSKEIRESSLFLTLNTKSSIICVLVNDIYSFVKESKQPDTMNYVKIMANKKKSIQKALNHTNKIINNTLKEIISIENQIKMQYKENNLYQYIERLNSVISATIYLHQNHKRYSVHNKNYINKNN
ncbi:hypothetical protein DICPUDRAFT_153584 [Dictyostelium purpureum]|uniref:uncharacterized protein n=1 Tax=Dictyostelium purpureum TaxID=5786 RepID=UPI0002054D7F|nr:uncharacterized protein DICPUDRAFT_153584 [Dictyostelium purpureum]EGC34225.1 hypothetical protein DICPUDRAFT_153584 [Dictyostelium purpureum]|eukprot:XP_003289235.1 hypothetical protein DICPUDRAFT_153584 [Dictyostelium purpureum]